MAKSQPTLPKDCKFIHVQVCLSEAVGAKTTFALSQKQSQSAIVLRGGIAEHNSSGGDKKQKEKDKNKYIELCVVPQ